MAILVTGGAGYIGSHVVLALLEQNIDVIVLDNLSHSSRKSINRIEKLIDKKIIFIEGDIRNRKCLRNLFSIHNIFAVIHLAALKSVGESIFNSLEYYNNNISGTILLLEEMRIAKILNFIFSSSATIYGADALSPYTENMTISGTTSPYSTSKLIIELFMQHLSKVEPAFTGIALRYFNPIGAHESSEIGEDSSFTSNLLPCIAQVATGKMDKLIIFGNDYNTPDGTAQRDYIHVVDLAKGHIRILNNLPKIKGYKAYNLGSGKCFSVLEIIKIFEKISGKKIPYEFKLRRVGDLPSFWADISLAKNELNWFPKYNIKDMICDMWNWYLKNPNGFL
ncbi:UDP-glucose 4-epimerase GalE [Pantoea sp. Aalb]|uniref:UDP-glucose 4-epimerase GalE n=1 Tax=Pantoea sp. Aalb TaxID=2576762 RepID=UPI00132770E4|nr:UDP-glucose 4-epimerase GalE [Pantoea sp. Aalb]MXP67329.1 UDP-glucose 4-epimerase GalE [Pantoea sp. Aalb]